MTFTTQSESLPLVDATRFTSGCPLIFNGAVSTSDTNTATSGRPEASRWSETSHSRQVLPPSKLDGGTGREMNGTGFAGSDTYSSNVATLDFGASNESFEPAER